MEDGLTRMEMRATTVYRLAIAILPKVYMEDVLVMVIRLVTI
jgi:hypothetical protein